MGHLRNTFNHIVGTLAAPAPHDGIEAELMLAGKKTLTWLQVPEKVDPDVVERDYHPLAKQRYHEQAKAIRKLDNAVKQGKLKSLDVLVHKQRDPETGEIVTLKQPTIQRHYCQPGQEAEMKRMAEFHKQLWNFKKPDDAMIDKNFGEYLGYRAKDVALWREKGMRAPMRAASQFIERHVHSVPRREKLLNRVMRVSNAINNTVRVAYQGTLLNQIAKEQKLADKAAKKAPGSLAMSSYLQGRLSQIESQQKKPAKPAGKKPKNPGMH